MYRHNICKLSKTLLRGHDPGVVERDAALRDNLVPGLGPDADLHHPLARCSRGLHLQGQEAGGGGPPGGRREGAEPGRLLPSPRLQLVAVPLQQYAQLLVAALPAQKSRT